MSGAMTQFLARRGGAGSFLHNDGADDLFNLMAGEELGRGKYRIVYDNHLMPGTVIKQDSGENHSNLMEWILWNEYKDTPLGKWMAPCDYISPRGIWLIQKKTIPALPGSFPKRVPALFCDLKPENWGCYEGRVVCHDYGNNALFTVAQNPAKRMQSVVWEHHV